MPFFVFSVTCLPNSLRNLCSIYNLKLPINLSSLSSSCTLTMQKLNFIIFYTLVYFLSQPFLRSTWQVSRLQNSFLPSSSEYGFSNKWERVHAIHRSINIFHENLGLRSVVTITTWPCIGFLMEILSKTLSFTELMPYD